MFPKSKKWDVKIGANNRLFVGDLQSDVVLLLIIKIDIFLEIQLQQKQ